jgi:integrase
MARALREVNLSTRAARERLKASGKPYYRALDQGLHLGYRKGARGAAWVVRWYVGDEAYKVESLDGRPDDVLDPDGATVLSWSQAQAAARKLFTHRQRQAAGLDVEQRDGPYTVNDAVADYLAAYAGGHTRGGGKALADITARVEAFIRPTLGKEAVERLTTKRLRDWLTHIAASPVRLRSGKNATERRVRQFDAADPEAVRQRRATANRILTILKATLNHAFREGHAPTDEAWRRVKPFHEVDAPKIRYLDPAETLRLVNGADIEFRPIVQAGLLTGCRYGELAKLTVSDYDAAAGTVTVRASKGGKRRHVILTDEGLRLFEAQTAGKHAGGLVFPRADGLPWGKSHQHRRMAEACKRAKIKPAISFHVLRHTYATALLRGGTPLPLIAGNLGHADTRMTSRHYAHLVPDHAASVIRAALPDIGIVAKSNVRRIGGAK